MLSHYALELKMFAVATSKGTSTPDLLCLRTSKPIYPSQALTFTLSPLHTHTHLCSLLTCIHFITTASLILTLTLTSNPTPSPFYSSSRHTPTLTPATLQMTFSLMILSIPFTICSSLNSSASWGRFLSSSTWDIYCWHPLTMSSRLSSFLGRSYPFSGFTVKRVHSLLCSIWFPLWPQRWWSGLFSSSSGVILISTTYQVTLLFLFTVLVLCHGTLSPSRLRKTAWHFNCKCLIWWVL